MLNNRLRITGEVELATEEERVTKIKALDLFVSNKINEFEVGTFNDLLKYMNIYFLMFLILQVR